MGFGQNNSGYIYKISGYEQCIRFINVIEPFLIVKRNEVLILKNYFETMKYSKHNGYDDKIHNYRYYLHYRMSKEKHENEEIEDNQLNTNPEGFLLKIQKEEEEIKNIKNENKIKRYKEKSENMKGINNHNFGKEKTNEIKRKISESIRKKKREMNLSLSDDNIRFVLRLLNEGKTHKYIQDEFKNNNLNLDRNTISSMEKGIIRPLELTNDEIKYYEKIDIKET